MKVTKTWLGIILVIISAMIIFTGTAAYRLGSKQNHPGNSAVPAIPDNSKTSSNPLNNNKWIIDDSTDKMGKRSVLLEHIGYTIEGSIKNGDGTGILTISGLSSLKTEDDALSIVLPTRASFATPLMFLRFDDDELIKISKLGLIGLSSGDLKQGWVTVDGGIIHAPMAQFNKYVQRLKTASKLRLQYAPASREGFITVEFDVRGFQNAMTEYKAQVKQK